MSTSNNKSDASSSDPSRCKSEREVLEESERTFRELFRLMPFFLMLIDTSGRTIEFNYASPDDRERETAGEGISYIDFIHEDDRKRAAMLFIDLFAVAVEAKNQWLLSGSITREECARRLRSTKISNEPIRMISAKGDRTFETSFSAGLWIGEADLKIKGALLSAIDMTELNSYRKKLEDSEKKYRELVEDKIRDVIFSLDGAGRFVTVNNNIRSKLGYLEEQVLGRSIIDIVYNDPADRSQINRETFRESLGRVMKDKSHDVRFTALCNHNFLGDPVMLQFKLDPIIENDEVVGVMGFASEISDDTLRQYLLGETVAYEIENRLIIADEVSFRVTRNLVKYLPESKISLLRMGVREMIVNAIEHGNLGITYEEKSKAQKNQNYHALLYQRQKNSENRHKKVYIEYRLDSGRALYTIRDQGKGFDHRKFLKSLPSNTNGEHLQHGRGIMITRSVFDEVKYNEAGNEVALVVRIGK